MDPLIPTVETSPAASIAVTVIARRRRGVSQPMLCVCNQLRKPVAADAAAIAHPMHMRVEHSEPPVGLRYKSRSEKPLAEWTPSSLLEGSAPQ